METRRRIPAACSWQARRHRRQKLVETEGQLYVADFTDSIGNVYVMPPNLATAFPNGIGGPSAVPATQKHGSRTAVYVEGSLAGKCRYVHDRRGSDGINGTGAGDNVISSMCGDTTSAVAPTV